VLQDQGPPGPGSSRTRVLQDQGPPGPGSSRTRVLQDQGPPGPGSSWDAKVTCKSYESHMRKSHAKVTKIAKVTKVTCKNKKLPFLWNCAGAGVREKKKLQKGLAS